MSNSNRPPSFWETIPGIITAIGTLLAGVAALITALYSAGIITPAKQHPSPQQAKVTQTETARQAARPRTVSVQPVSKKEPLSPAQPKQGDIMIEPMTGMKFVYVPRGCFMMGSDSGSDDEKPVHKVCVDAFWMGKYEVTQGEWRKVMGTNPAHFQKGDNYPVESISWKDAQKFISELNRKSARNYRLPTEAEWEYACRANGTGKYCGGDNPDDLAWYRENSGKSTHPVGKKQANDFGLYDMSGNVWEWCNDRFDENYYSSSPQDNPTRPLFGSDRVIRGGSWINGHRYMCSAFRFKYAPDFLDDNMGFRLVLPIR